MMAMLRIVSLGITYHHTEGILKSVMEPEVHPQEGTRMRNFWGLLSETFNEWLEDKAPRLGAALAYYAAFSIAPLLVLLVAVVGFFYKDDSLPRIQSQIAMMAGYNAAAAIIATIHGVKNS